MKKILPCFLIVILTLTSVACGGNSTTSNENDSDNTSTETESSSDDKSESVEDSTEKKVIKIALQEDTTGGFQAAIDGFNDSQDEYEAEWVTMPNDSDQMRDQFNTSLSAGSSEYDVLSLDVVWAGDMAAAGYIEALDSYMKDAGRSMSDYNTGSMASGSYNAKQYTLPFYPDLGILFYRSDIVSEKDAQELESGDYTWAELLEMAEIYKGEEGTSAGLAFQAAQYEGLVCNLNEFTGGFEDIEEGLEIMKQAVTSDVTPTDILNYQESESCNSFINGESVFLRNWPYVWGSIATEGSISQDQVGIAPLPEGSCIGGWLLAINENSKNKEGAWALLDYMTSEEGQRIMSSITGNIPGYNALLDDAEVLAANELLSRPGFQIALENTIARPVSDNYSETSDAIQQAAHKFLSGSQELEATAEEIKTALGK